LVQYRKVLAIEPKNAIALLKVGEVQLADNNTDGAIKSLLESIKASPSARTYTSLAEAHVAQHNTDAALDAYRHARALEPRNADLLTAYGLLLYEAGQLDEAAKVLEESVSIQPRATTHNHLGIAYQVSCV
jgi:Tfp pilus assembly protein PilF